MNMENDYMILQLAKARQRDFLAEADAEREANRKAPNRVSLRRPLFGRRNR